MRPLLLLALCLSWQTAGAVLWHPDMTDQEAINLGALPQFSSQAGVSGCSAALLNSEWVVYAGHCVSFVDGARVTVSYSFAGQSFTRAGTVYLTPNGDPGYDDVALVQLDTPITGPAAWVAPYRGFDEFQRLGWQVGRGTSGTLGVNTASGGGIFRAMTQLTVSSVLENQSGTGSSIIPQHIYYNYNGSPEAMPPNVLTTRFEGGTGPGDSGGPFYIYKQGRLFNASVVSGPQSGSYRNSRLSTHLDAIMERSGLTFAYPKATEATAIWVAEDLLADQANGTLVLDWSDRYHQLSWTGGDGATAGAPQLIEAATPAGMAAIRFDGDAAMQLSEAANPFTNETSMSVAFVIRPTAAGSGGQAIAFDTTGVLDASVEGGTNGWGLSLAATGRFGWILDDTDGSVKSAFRGAEGNGSAVTGDWHIVVATWDGADILHDNAGDDRNMKLFVDTLEQSTELQGPNHFNIGRAAQSLLLGKSQTNSAVGFSGEIAEVRFYRGALQLHEVDRLLTGLREQYISGPLGVVFERPWSSQIALPAGHSLRTRGYLTGGATSIVWNVASGPAPVTFSDALSPDTDIEFEAPGVYELEAVVSNGLTSAATSLSVLVDLPGSEPSTAEAFAVPGNWIDSSIGAHDIGGSVESPAGVSVTAAGRGVGIGEGETYDEGRFHWKPVAGDFNWVARLDSIGNVDGPTRAGLMVRGGLGPIDAAAFVGFAPDGKLYSLIRRNGGYWGDLSAEDDPGVTLPAYLKIERRGDDFRFFISQDGQSFSQTGPVHTVSLPGIARVGLYASSGQAANTINAVFSQRDLSQAGFAQASTTRLSRLSSGSALRYHPEFSGSADPWLKISSESGPSSLSYRPIYEAEKEVWQAVTSIGGSYLSRFTVDDGNTLSFQRRADSITFNQRYDFNLDGDTEGWTANNVSGLAVVDGVIRGVPTSGDPQISRGGLTLNGDVFTRVTVRMRASIDSSVQLFWGTSENGAFSTVRRETVDYTGDGEFQVLEFDLSAVAEWAGSTITNLRLDPAEGSSATGGSFEIDSIEISDGQALPEPTAALRYDFLQSNDFEGWERTKDIMDAYVLGGRLQGRSTGSDPVLTQEELNFQADAIQAVLIRIRASISGSMQLFWATSEAAGFAGTRSVSAPITGGGVWQTIRMPLAGHPEWDGRTITRLRFDPTNQANTDFAIESIVLSDGDADADGIPDTFELANKLDPLNSLDASEDANGDGFTNLEAFIAGTDPQNPADSFRVKAVERVGSGIELRIDGKGGRLYQLLRSETLNPSDWQPVDGADAGPLAVDQSVVLEDPESFDRVFYKVRVSMP